MGFQGATSGKEPTCQCRRHEMWVQSLGWEDALEKGMATYFSISAWKIPWIEEPGRLQSIGLQRVGHNWSDLAHTNIWEIDGITVETVSDFILGGSKITAGGDCSREIKRCLLLRRKVVTNLDGIFKSWDITLPTKVCLVKAIVFPVVMLWMWELDYEESWAPKNWCFWTMVLEKSLERPLDCKEIQPVCPEGHQSWVFIGRTDAEAETPILWPPHAKRWFIGKDPDAGRNWGKEEKGTKEDEMTGWHHRLDGHEFR